MPQADVDDVLPPCSWITLLFVDINPTHHCAPLRSGFAGLGLVVQRSGGAQRCQPVFSIVCHASIASWRSIRLCICGIG
ncbi:hypothetical protein [Synechococcus sp. MIT S1220]|uniref:hypothetical protein n=1 Tax=Synechococcus sp. MIT S1220 TaxID=3082549 RepID=UPI0039AFDB6F